LIVEHEVTNDVTDQAQLTTMAVRAKETLGVEQREVVADRGYYDGDEVKKCAEAGITTYIAKPLTSANTKRGLYTKQDFTYDTERDCYCCPQGEELSFRFETIEQGRGTRYYATSACRTCAVKAQCTTNKGGRRITRWVDEHLLDEMESRVSAQPEVMKLRKQLAEHPFGTIKRTMQSGYFLMRGLKKVRGEMSLTVLAYNIKRVLNILGVEKMTEAVA
jgi:macrodomain Ter protein organizer (MatP/YcbG family)